ncbi:MAG: hypothetical protein ABIQ31_20290 [Ferruginibacter sp.]
MAIVEESQRQIKGGQYFTDDEVNKKPDGWWENNWSANAKTDKIAILKYWIDTNKPTTHSRKLSLLLKEAVNLISKNPGILHLTVKENVEVKIAMDNLNYLQNYHRQYPPTCHF